LNVIFLDFDGVLNTYEDYCDEYKRYKSKEEINKKIERRFSILSDICREYNCKVVISASIKCLLDEETLKIHDNNERLRYIFDMFKKYNIECIGRTPELIIRNNGLYYPASRQMEIMLYLYRHPEIDHYCVIDDYFPKKGIDLEKIKNHLVETIDGTDTPNDGLLERHKELVGKVLQEENEVKRLIKIRNKIKKKNS